MTPSDGRNAVGVVVPTWNSATTLDWTLLSLSHQRGCTVRVVVVDSESEDDTLQICRRWDVPTIGVAPGNMYQAIEAGLATLDTPWLTWVGSDDVVFADGYRRLVATAQASRADVAYGQCDNIDDAGRFLFSLAPAPPDQMAAYFRTGLLPFSQVASIFSRALYERLGGFDLSLRLAADTEFFGRALLSGARFSRVAPPAVACWRLHRGQQTVRQSSEVMRERAALATRFGGRWHDRVTVWLRWHTANVDQYAIRVLRRLSRAGRPR
jgi:glycosyltransferase involved in cell wall biosynthesis